MRRCTSPSASPSWGPFSPAAGDFALGDRDSTRTSSSRVTQTIMEGRRAAISGIGCNRRRVPRRRPRPVPERSAVCRCTSVSPVTHPGLPFPGTGCMPKPDPEIARRMEPNLPLNSPCDRSLRRPWSAAATMRTPCRGHRRCWTGRSARSSTAPCLWPFLRPPLSQRAYVDPGNFATTSREEPQFGVHVFLWAIVAITSWPC